MSQKSNKSVLQDYDDGYGSGSDNKSSKEIIRSYSRERPKSNVVKASRSASDL